MLYYMTSAALIIVYVSICYYMFYVLFYFTEILLLYPFRHRVNKLKKNKKKHKRKSVIIYTYLGKSDISIGSIQKNGFKKNALNLFRFVWRMMLLQYNISTSKWNVLFLKIRTFCTVQ